MGNVWEGNRERLYSSARREITLPNLCTSGFLVTLASRGEACRSADLGCLFDNLRLEAKGDSNRRYKNLSYMLSSHAFYLPHIHAPLYTTRTGFVAQLCRFSSFLNIAVQFKKSRYYFFDPLPSPLSGSNKQPCRRLPAAQQAAVLALHADGGLVLAGVLALGRCAPPALEDKDGQSRSLFEVPFEKIAFHSTSLLSEV